MLLTEFAATQMNRTSTCIVIRDVMPWCVYDFRIYDSQNLNNTFYEFPSPKENEIHIQEMLVMVLVLMAVDGGHSIEHRH